MIERRGFVAGLTALVLAAPEARAMGRVPIGGKLRFRVPWRLSSIDPHDLHDPVAAIFGSAIADPVYARDPAGRVYPSLADGMPFVEAGETLVKLRPDLRTAKGRGLSGHDLAWSIKRCRARAAGGLFAQTTPFVHSFRDRPLVVGFGEADPKRLAFLLSAPTSALLPAGFSPHRPDGTGALVARPAGSSLFLSRNRNASRGPSFLEAIQVDGAASINDSLRAFETKRDDIGWLGLGLHGRRRGALRFDRGVMGWALLATGKRAGKWGMPGLAQRLANQVSIGRLGVGVSGGGNGGGGGWQGDPANLIYDSAHPQLRLIADAVAAKLTSPGHEVTAVPVSGATLRAARRSGDYTLAIDFTRSLQLPGTTGLALATAEKHSLGVEMGKRKRWPDGAARALTAGRRIGVLGTIRLAGGTAPGILLAGRADGRGISWGGSYRSRY